jgi:hypothetical protein
MFVTKKKLAKMVQVLTLNDGDVIVLRTNKGFREWIKVLEVIIHRLKVSKKIDVTALVLPDEVRFGAVGEKEMNNAGWFKQDAQEVKRILEDNELLYEWNIGIKKLHVEDTLKNYEIIEDLKEKLKQYEN